FQTEVVQVVAGSHHFGDRFHAAPEVGEKTFVRGELGCRVRTLLLALGYGPGDHPVTFHVSHGLAPFRRASRSPCATSCDVGVSRFTAMTRICFHSAGVSGARMSISFGVCSVWNVVSPGYSW